MLRRNANQQESQVNASWSGFDQFVQESNESSSSTRKQLSAESDLEVFTNESLVSDLKSPLFCGKMDGPSHDHLKDDEWVRLPSRENAAEPWRKRIRAVPSHYDYHDTSTTKSAQASCDGSNKPVGSKKRQLAEISRIEEEVRKMDVNVVATQQGEETLLAAQAQPITKTNTTS